MVLSRSLTCLASFVLIGFDICFNDDIGDLMCYFDLGDLRSLESLGLGLLEKGDLDNEELCFLVLLLDSFFLLLFLDLLLVILFFLLGSINENLY